MFVWIWLISVPQRDHARVKQLSERLINSINAQVEHVVRNGDVNGYPGCVNLSFAYVEGESLLMALKVSMTVLQRRGLSEVLTVCRISRFRRAVHVPLRPWNHPMF